MATGKPYDALIIGSGIGGLSTGIILSRLGMQVAVIEKNPLPGGLMRSFTRNGADCPVGVHYFGAFAEGQSLRRMVDYLGVNLAVERMGCGGPIDRYLFDDFTFDLPAGVDAFAAALEEAFPEDRGPIAVVTASLRDLAVLQDSLAFLSPGAIPVLDMDLFSPLSVYLTKLGCSPRLRAVLCVASNWMGLSERQCPVFYHHLALASYLMSSWRLRSGGSEMAEAFAARLKGLGGTLLSGDPVEEILTAGGEAAGVRLASGRELAAGRVVAAIHPKAVLKLLPEGAVKPLLARRIRGLAETESLFSASVALDAGAHPPLPYNTYRLHTDPEGLISEGVFYQIRAGAAGKSLLTIIARSSYARWQRWEETTTGRRGPDYRREKISLAEALLAQAGDVFGPLTGASLLDAYTPLTIRDWVNAPEGSPYGVMRSTDQLAAASALHRRMVGGLFFAGQNALAPGVLGTVLGSFDAVRRMIGAERFSAEVFAFL